MAGLVTTEQDAVADHQQTPLAEHLGAYLEHQEAKGVTAGRIKTTRQRFEQVAADCRFGRLSDLAGAALERWLVARQADGMSAGSRNGYREACVGFGNWCVRTHRLTENAFADVPKADARADQRRKRRALTEGELVRLLDVARHRPLLDAMTVRRGFRKGQPIAKLKAETRRRLELLGWERALIYKTLVLTGLRKGELASLTAGSLVLNGPTPYAVLNAADEKNRQGSDIPLRADLVADIGRWLDHKLKAAQDAAERENRPIPARLPADTPLFTVPTGLVRIMDRDLRTAAIPKRDERGWTVDVHALRHSFGTHLSKGGVPLRTAQAAMRHSDPSLTANVYTDPKLLDVAGALDALPALPLDGNRAEHKRATGTDDALASALAPMLAPKAGEACANGAIADRDGEHDPYCERPDARDVSAYVVKRKDPLSVADSESHDSGRLDSNQRPLRPERSALARLSHAPWLLRVC